MALALGSWLCALRVRVYTLVQVCVWTQVCVCPSLTGESRKVPESPRGWSVLLGVRRLPAEREGRGPGLRSQPLSLTEPGAVAGRRGCRAECAWVPCDVVCVWGARGRQVAALVGGSARSPPLPAPFLVWGCTCPATPARLGSKCGSTVRMAGSVLSSGCWEGTPTFPGPPRQGLTALGQDSTPGSLNTRVTQRGADP